MMRLWRCLTALVLALLLTLSVGAAGTAGFDVVLVNAVGIFERNLANAVVIADHLVSPCPLVLAVVGIDIFESLDEFLDGLDVSIFQVVDDSLFL